LAEGEKKESGERICDSSSRRIDEGSNRRKRRDLVVVGERKGRRDWSGFETEERDYREREKVLVSRNDDGRAKSK